MLYYYNYCYLKLLKLISKPQPQRPPGCLQAKLLLQPRRRTEALWRFRAPEPPAPVQPPPGPAELLVAPLMNHTKAVNHKPGVMAGFPPFFFPKFFWGGLGSHIFLHLPPAVPFSPENTKNQSLLHLTTDPLALPSLPKAKSPGSFPNSRSHQDRVRAPILTWCNSLILSPY